MGVEARVSKMKRGLDIFLLKKALYATPLVIMFYDNLGQNICIYNTKFDDLHFINIYKYNSYVTVCVNIL